MEIYTIVERLVGPVLPTGESHIDRERLISLRKTIGLVESLLKDIVLAASAADNPQKSMRTIGIEAQEFLKDLTERG